MFLEIESLLKETEEKVSEQQREMETKERERREKELELEAKEREREERERAAEARERAGVREIERLKEELEIEKRLVLVKCEENDSSKLKISQLNTQVGSVSTHKHINIH